MQELIGQRLGQYQIVEMIGQGGMAAVFKAWQPGLERWVAVKVLPPASAADPHFSAHFLREAKAIAKLEHPHILPVYDFGQQGRYIYLVMRYIEGSRTLGDMMRQPLSLQQALVYLEQAAAALDYAHKRGVIHRDVKPTNILLDRTWVFLADFGLARLTETAALQITDIALGTPAYMSPEQGRGAGVDVRTDVYAMGAIVYQMLSGEIPHLAEASQAILYRRNHEPPPSLESARSDLPPLLDEIIQTALATRPADRFESAGAFVTALRRAVESTGAASLLTRSAQPLAGLPYPSAPVSPAPAIASPPDRVAVRPGLPWLPWLAAGLGAVLMTMLLAVGVAWMLSRPATPTPSAEITPTEPVATLAPTPVVVPTDPPPAPTATPTELAQSCSRSAGGPFESLWPDYRRQLGCPTGEPQTISTIAEETFQGGHLFWRRDTDQVYLIFDRQRDGTELVEGQWQLIPPEWKWDGSDPEGVGLTPPPGLVEPKRGFGWLWRTHLGGADGPLGWALDREYGFDNVGQAQPFEQGLMFKGSAPKVYVLLNNGQFYAR
ncbi:MAG: protein kinase [Anaerolineae bacterium]|nr:protein kinase [Anaerolineae bacterium]